MAVKLSPIWGAGAQLLDNSGNVLSGGKIYTYAAGTTTPATTYTSSNGITANSNPIILNSAGRVPYEIWLTDGIAYKFVLKDSNDTLIATYDNLTGINSSTDAENVSYNPPFTGAVGTNVEDKLAQTVSVKDFGATVYHTVRIPTDYPTMQDAFTALAPGVCKSGQYFNILIEAGHQITHGLSLVFGDYSHFRISSEDATVTLAPGFVFVSVQNSVLYFQQCMAPNVAIKINAGGLGGRTIAYISSIGKVEQTFGAINAGTDCLYMDSGSIVNAFRTVWTGAQSRNAWVTRNCFLDAEESVFSNSLGDGVTIRRGSIANLTNCLIDDNAGTGVICTRGYINFQGREDAGGPRLASASRNAGGVVVTRGSRATLTGLSANDNTTTGVTVVSGSIADFDDGEATGNDIGVRAYQGGIISAVEAVITNNDRNIVCQGAGSAVDAASATLSDSDTQIIEALDGGSVSAPNAIGNNAGTIAIDASNGSNVSVAGGTFDNAGERGILCENATVSAVGASFQSAGTEGIRAISGTIYFKNGNAQKTPGTDTTSDINLTEGSIIHAYGATGGYPATVTPNTISGNRGILFTA